MILLSSFVNGSNHTGSSHIVAFFGRFYRLRNIFYSINDFYFNKANGNGANTFFSMLRYLFIGSLF